MWNGGWNVDCSRGGLARPSRRDANALPELAADAVQDEHPCINPVDNTVNFELLNTSRLGPWHLRVSSAEFGHIRVAFRRFAHSYNDATTTSYLVHLGINQCFMDVQRPLGFHFHRSLLRKYALQKLSAKSEHIPGIFYATRI